MKTIHYPYKIRSHFLTIAPMAPFTPKSTSMLRSALSALHLRYSIAIPRFISCANTGRPQGGGQEGALTPPPLEIKKYRGPHKDNLTRKIKKNFFLKIKQRN